MTHPTDESDIRNAALEEAAQAAEHWGDRYSVGVGIARGIRALKSDPAPVPAANAALEEGAASFQERVSAAHHALFHDDPTDVEERRARFLEEAIELAQAFGMSYEDMHALVERQRTRPVGDPEKEVGGVAVTLASLCVVAGIDLAACAEEDLRILNTPEKIAHVRAKRATRHGRGPLPGFDPAAPKPFTFADPAAQLQHERHRAESKRRDGE